MSMIKKLGLIGMISTFLISTTVLAGSPKPLPNGGKSCGSCSARGINLDNYKAMCKKPSCK